MRLVVLGLVAAVAGCFPGLAPPVRTTHAGAPGRLHDGQMAVELAGTFATAGSSLSHALSDFVVVEGGMETSESFTMSFVGGRLQLGAEDRQGATAIDFEAGVGVGGGQSCAGQEGCDDFPLRPAAYGVYGGAGLAIGVGWLRAFGRLRMQRTDGDGLPATTWITGLCGLQARIKEYVLLHGSLGGGTFDPRLGLGTMIEGGITVRWGPDA